MNPYFSATDETRIEQPRIEHGLNTEWGIQNPCSISVSSVARIIVLFLSAFCLLHSAFDVCAITTSTQIVASVTITNLTGITNGATFTVNGASRTWTNDPTVNPAIWIATTNTTAYATTNLLINYQRYAAAGPVFARTNGGSATSFQLVSGPNLALSVAPSAGYASIRYFTNIFTNQQPVMVPLPATPDTTARTNQASGLVEGIELYATNSWTMFAFALNNYVRDRKSVV